MSVEQSSLPAPPAGMDLTALKLLGVQVASDPTTAPNIGYGLEPGVHLALQTDLAAAVTGVSAAQASAAAANTAAAAAQSAASAAAATAGNAIPAAAIGAANGVAAFGDARIVGALQPATGVINLPSIAALRAYPFATLANGAQITLSGYYVAGDCPARTYYWNNTDTTADDAGAFINPTGNAGAGRFRYINQNHVVSPSTWGAKGDGSFDDTAAFQAAVNYAGGHGSSVHVHQPRMTVSTVVFPANATVKVFGNGSNVTQIYRGTMFDATVAAAAGGTLPAGTYRGLVYAYNGSTILRVQPFGYPTLDGTTTTALNVSWATVPGATDYVIYYTSGASVYGNTTYSQDAGTATSATISALGSAPTSFTTPVPSVPSESYVTGCPIYSDPVFQYPFAYGENVLQDIQINGNGRAARSVEFSDYTGGGTPGYAYSLAAENVDLFGAQFQQLYFGARRFASQMTNVNCNGGWQGAAAASSADHIWRGCQFNYARDANAALYGVTNLTSDASNYFDGVTGLKLRISSHNSFVDGSVDSNSLCGIDIDLTSSGNSFSCRLSNDGATYNVYNNGKQNAFDGSILISGGNNPPPYMIFNDTNVDFCRVSNVSMFVPSGGTYSYPWATAFTNTPKLLRGSLIGSRTSEVPVGYHNVTVATGLTATGTTQATALVLSAQINRITGYSGNNSATIDQALAGVALKVFNDQANPLTLYPPPGAGFDNATTNAAITVPPNSMADVTWSSATGGVVTIATIFDPSNYRGAAGGAILYGTGNKIYQTNGVAGGLNSVSNGYGARATGETCTADGYYSMADGRDSNTRFRDGVQAYGVGLFSVSGDQQTVRGLLRATATDANPVRLYATGSTASSTNIFNIPDDFRAYGLTIKVTAINKSVANTAWRCSFSDHILSRGTGAASVQLDGGMAAIGPDGTPRAVGSGLTGIGATLAPDNTTAGLNLTFQPPTGNTGNWHIYASVVSDEVG